MYLIIAYIFKGGKGVSEMSSQTTILHFSRVRKQIAHLISATCLGDLCVAINSLGKPAVGRSEHNEVLSYINRLKSEVFSSHQMLVKIVYPDFWFLFFNSSSMYMYSIEDFGSSCFTECIAIMIHRTVFQCIMIHGHQKWSITASQK